VAAPAARLAGDDYVPLRARGASGVCRADCADAVRAALASADTLHAWAAAQPDRRELRGRGAAYAVTLPDDAADVVVRHSAHGGLLAPVTRDLFLAPTRAPHELDTARRLRARGVRTPEVIAWLAYPAGPFFRRADVATRLVPDGRDLADALADPARPRGPGAPWLRATAALLHALAAAGARHPDLNLKNVLLAPDADGAPAAWALDVDVVTLTAALPDARQVADAARANWARLHRSLEKWRRLHALPLDDDEIAALAEAALADAAR